MLARRLESPLAVAPHHDKPGGGGRPHRRRSCARSGGPPGDGHRRGDVRAGRLRCAAACDARGRRPRLTYRRWCRSTCAVRSRCDPTNGNQFALVLLSTCRRRSAARSAGWSRPRRGCARSGDARGVADLRPVAGPGVPAPPGAVLATDFARKATGVTTSVRGPGRTAAPRRAADHPAQWGWAPMSADQSFRSGSRRAECTSASESTPPDPGPGGPRRGAGRGWQRYSLMRDRGRLSAQRLSPRRRSGRVPRAAPSRSGHGQETNVGRRLAGVRRFKRVLNAGVLTGWRWLDRAGEIVTGTRAADMAASATAPASASRPRPWSAPARSTSARASWSAGRRRWPPATDPRPGRPRGGPWSWATSVQCSARGWRSWRTVGPESATSGSSQDVFVSDSGHGYQDPDRPIGEQFGGHHPVRIGAGSGSATARSCSRAPTSGQRGRRRRLGRPRPDCHSVVGGAPHPPDPSLRGGIGWVGTRGDVRPVVVGTWGDAVSRRATTPHLTAPGWVAREAGPCARPAAVTPCYLVPQVLQQVGYRR